MIRIARIRIALVALVAGGACAADAHPPAPVPAAPLQRDHGELAFTPLIPDGPSWTGDPLRGVSARSNAGQIFLVGAMPVGRDRVGLLVVDAGPRLCTRGVVALADPPVGRRALGFAHVPPAMRVVHEGLPWDAMAKPRHRRTRATVWIDRRRRWIDATVELDIEDLHGPVWLEAALGDRLQVVEVTRAGRALPWAAQDVWLRVETGGALAGPLRLRLRGVPDRDGDWISADAALVTHLLPVMLGQAPALDLTIHVPEGDRVDGAAAAVPAPSAPGWRGWRLRGHADDPIAVVQAETAAPPRTIDRAGVRWTVTGPSTLDAALPAAIDQVAVLGPPTEPATRVVGFPAAARPFVARAGRAPIALVSWTDADPIDDRHALTAALAARWLAAAPDASHQPCAWQDAAAQAIGTWGLADDDARRIRARWTSRAGDAQPFRLAYPGPATPGLRTEHCARGALLWIELDRRLGRDRTIALVRALRAQPGPGAGWSDVADAVARQPGAAGTAAWLRGWIDRPAPPVLGLQVIARDAGTIRAELLQDPGGCLDSTPTDSDFAVPPFRGLVTVAAMAGPREVARVEVEAGLVRAPLTFAADPAITHLVVDPDHRLPLVAGLRLAVAVPATSCEGDSCDIRSR